jgi:hypothetical protein
MSSSERTFVLHFRDRNVLVFNDQCPRYPVSLLLQARRCTAPLAVGSPTGLTADTPLQDILALARTTFSSLKLTAAEDIVIIGGGADCPWYGNVELSERAWGSFCSQLTYVTVTFKRGM